MAILKENPLHIEIAVEQSDFIQVEMLENVIDSQDLKKETLRTFLIQSAVCFLAAVFFLIQNWVAKEAWWFCLVFFLFFALHFLYNYFYGIQQDLYRNLAHLIQSDAKGNTFFLPEEGMVNFYPEKVEYLTNENRRYFEYNQIAHIKITKLLFIFVMKNSTEKSMRGFQYMVVPKRCLQTSQEEQLNDLCDFIVSTYGLTAWTDTDLFN